jgi:hypothetical protein
LRHNYPRYLHIGDPRRSTQPSDTTHLHWWPPTTHATSDKTSHTTFTCRTTARSYGASYNITTETTFTIWRGLVTAVMYQVTGLTCSFVYGMGLQLAGIIHNNLAGHAHLLCFQMRPANQPAITGVDLCHKKAGRPWFTETRVIRYEPFISVHNATFRSGCYVIDKGSNKTCENNIILPTNIHYLKIHVRNWIRSQTSQWYTTRIKYTLGNQMQYVKRNTHSPSHFPSYGFLIHGL